MNNKKKTGESKSKKKRPFINFPSNLVGKKMKFYLTKNFKAKKKKKPLSLLAKARLGEQGNTFHETVN